jgi:hypothetical protein
MVTQKLANLVQYPNREVQTPFQSCLTDTASKKKKTHGTPSAAKKKAKRAAKDDEEIGSFTNLLNEPALSCPLHCGLCVCVACSSAG